MKGLSTEPTELPVAHLNTPPKTLTWSKLSKLIAWVSLVAVILVHSGQGLKYAASDISDAVKSSLSVLEPEPTTPVCKLHTKLSPEGVDKFNSIINFNSTDYRQHSLKLWSEAIQVRSESFDDLGAVDEDVRWKGIGDLQEYLKDKFPLIFENAEVEYVNTYGLVITLPGSNSTLRPYMLAAHMDVVPVPEETVDRWTYPPFSGYFDGEWVWGRGASDCKNTLIAIMEAVSSLISQGFEPKRTLILAFGSDEESSGFQGAGEIAKHLETKLGPDSLELILDEGSEISEMNGTLFALAGTGEKGYVDVNISLTTTGGHSSIPPDHTAIGILSMIITLIEQRASKPNLTAINPFYHTLQCVAEHGVDVDPILQKDILKMDTDKLALKRVTDAVGTWPLEKNLIKTTRAVDIIKGGMKVNALPEEVYTVVNSRIAVESSINETLTEYTKLITSVAARMQILVDAFGVIVNVTHGTPTAGLIKLTTHNPLEPAPLTPLEDNPTWDLLGGTIRSTFEKDNIVVAPGMSTGNTDTRFYWNLTDNIYRFTPSRSEGSLNIHSIDERVRLDNHIEAVGFFYQFIRNVELYYS